MDSHLKALIDLQAVDTRIAGLEADAARIPREIATIHAAVGEARAQVDQTKARLDTARKEQRALEKDLEVVQARRVKSEARLYEVKTNKEYSAVLVEIEDIKQEKARVEDQILNIMESHERLSVDIRDADARFKSREVQGKSEEATLQEKLRGVEGELALVRSERRDLASQLPVAVLADYDGLLRARGGLAVVEVAKPQSCGGCRVTIPPQRIQELKPQNALIRCESCGRYLYWTP
jgi:predicted  nucleic acid-binding Zn-ribbon protein